jgi:hypothetical protein
LGRLVVPQGNRVVLVDRRIDPEDLGHRRWLANPRPEVHAKLAEEYKADPFGAAVRKSLEQRARGQLALEAGDLDQAWGHFGD